MLYIKKLCTFTNCKYTIFKYLRRNPVHVPIVAAQFLPFQPLDSMSLSSPHLLSTIYPKH